MGDGEPLVGLVLDCVPQPNEITTDKPAKDDSGVPAEQLNTGANVKFPVMTVHAASSYAAATATVGEYDNNLQPAPLGHPIPYEQLVVSTVEI